MTDEEEYVEMFVETFTDDTEECAPAKQLCLTAFAEAKARFGRDIALGAFADAYVEIFEQVFTERFNEHRRGKLN